MIYKKNEKRKEQITVGIGKQAKWNGGDVQRGYGSNMKYIRWWMLTWIYNYTTAYIVAHTIGINVSYRFSNRIIPDSLSGSNLTGARARFLMYELLSNLVIVVVWQISWTQDNGKFCGCCQELLEFVINVHVLVHSHSHWVVLGVQHVVAFA